MDKLKNMKETLMGAAQMQISGNLTEVDAKELGEVIDMIKDLEEAIYYCTITEAMNQPKHYGPYIPYPMNPDYRDLDREYGRMYYNGSGNGGNSYAGSSGQGGRGTSDGGANSNGGNYRSYYEKMMPPYEYPQEMLKDRREGMSPFARKMYMESKEMHQTKEVQMKELEKYLQELSHDVTEMIQDASPEEKQMLQQKLSLLVTKIK